MVLGDKELVLDSLV